MINNSSYFPSSSSLQQFISPSPLNNVPPTFSIQSQRPPGPYTNNNKVSFYIINSSGSGDGRWLPIFLVNSGHLKINFLTGLLSWIYINVPNI